MASWTKSTTAAAMACIAAVSSAGWVQEGNAVAAETSEKPAPQQGTATPAYWTYQDFLDKKTPQTYTIRPGHPRLLITPTNKGEILEKIKAAPKVWTRIIQDAEKGKDGEAILACAAIHQLGLAPGFKYALSREEYGRKGVKLLVADEPTGRRRGDFTRYMVLPCGYDWLFDLLSAEQKLALAKRMAKKAAGMKDGPCTVHGPKMVMGLAFYGDGVDDDAARVIVESEWKEWWDPKAKSKNLVSLLIYSEDSGCPDGYMYCRTHLLPVLAAWKTATGQDYFANMGYFRGLPYYWAAKGLPSEPWDQLPLHNYMAGSFYPAQHLALMVTGILSDVDPRGASFARWWADEGRGFEVLCMRGVMEGKIFYGLLIGDPRVKGRSPKELGLPTTARFGGGTNTVYARSAWDDPDGTLIGFANSRFPSLRLQKTTNVFSLWKNRAPLLPYRGALAGHFYTGGMAVETGPLFYRDNVRVAGKGAGSRAPYGDSARGRDIGTPISMVSEADAYDFIRSNSRAFPGVSKCERTVVYLRPAGPGKVDYVAVLDRFSVEDKEITPHVVYQSVFEPRIGTDWSGQEQGAKVRDGHWRIEKASCITVTHEHEAMKSHGRAFLKVLHPASVVILKVGGEKHFVDTLSGKSTARPGPYLWFAKATRDKQIARGGYWRFHIVPEAPSAAYSILTAIEPTDSKQAKPSGELELLPSEEFLAARLGPNLVLFSRSGAALESGSVKITSKRLYRIVVTDLKPEAKYLVTLGGKEIARSEASSAGTLLLQRAEWPTETLLEVRGDTRDR